MTPNDKFRANVIVKGTRTKEMFKKNLFIFLILIQNCATLISIPDWNKKNAPVFYSGARCEVGLMIENGILHEPIYIIDLPFSFLLLPQNQLMVQGICPIRFQSVVFGMVPTADY